MASDSNLFRALKLVLRPTIRFCLRRSLGLQDLISAAKETFVELAVEEMGAQEQKVNVSRISMVTGVHRKDVAKFHKSGEGLEAAERISTRVIGQWKRDRRFQTDNGRPRVLSVKGEDAEFTRLVRLVSKEVRPASVLFELERAGIVQISKKGAALRGKVYEPKRRAMEVYSMLSEDLEDLMLAAVENVEAEDREEDPVNIHVKTEFDNVSEEDLEKIREWFDRKCYQWGQQAEKYLASFDLDINPDDEKIGGKRVALGIFTKT